MKPALSTLATVLLVIVFGLLLWRFLGGSPWEWLRSIGGD